VSDLLSTIAKRLVSDEVNRPWDFGYNNCQLYVERVLNTPKFKHFLEPLVTGSQPAYSFNFICRPGSHYYDQTEDDWEEPYGLTEDYLFGFRDGYHDDSDIFDYLQTYWYNRAASLLRSQNTTNSSRGIARKPKEIQLTNVGLVALQDIFGASLLTRGQLYNFISSRIEACMGFRSHPKTPGLGWGTGIVTASNYLPQGNFCRLQPMSCPALIAFATIVIGQSFQRKPMLRLIDASGVASNRRNQPTLTDLRIGRTLCLTNRRKRMRKAGRILSSQRPSLAALVLFLPGPFLLLT
jgi:hypothetical protein